MATLAQSLVNLRNEVNARWPNRSKASDGWIGDVKHQATTSDHNPDSRGIVHAIDITASGVEMAAIIAALKKHPSVNYFIHKGQIWERSRGFVPRKYTGPDPHLHHIHISILHGVAAENNATPWLAQQAPVAAKPTPAPAKYNLTRMLKKGSQGADVKELQKKVGATADGIFGPKTHNAVVAYQKSKKLAADGIVGKSTANALGWTFQGK